MMWMMICVWSCRPDPGAPSYPSVGELPNFGGPDPYEDGEDRRSLGIFYEMGASESYSIDNTERFFYIWGNSFSLFTTDDCTEGYQADRLVVGDLGWWGGGVFWSTPSDFSEWRTLSISLQSTNDDITGLNVGLGQGDGEVLHWFPVVEHGFVYDGEWHHLLIDLTPAWEVLDPTQIQMAFNIEGGGEAGSELLIDNLYFTKEEAP